MSLRFIPWLILLIIGLHFSGHSQIRPTVQFKKWEQSLVFSLVMGDHFKNDSADIFIDGTLFFLNVKLNSNLSDGCADVLVDIHKDECGEYRAGIFRGDSIKINPLPAIVQVKIVLNGKPFEYNIDPGNGKYALFAKQADGQMIFRQSHRQPNFE
jgi:hypothetical protein